jgi:hypothetical protein
MLNKHCPYRVADSKRFTREHPRRPSVDFSATPMPCPIAAEWLAKWELTVDRTLNGAEPLPIQLNTHGRSAESGHFNLAWREQ